MPCVPGQSSGGLGREVAGGPGRWAGLGGSSGFYSEMGSCWRVLDREVRHALTYVSTEAFRLPTCNSDFRPARELAGAPLRRRVRASDET